MFVRLFLLRISTTRREKEKIPATGPPSALHKASSAVCRLMLLTGFVYLVLGYLDKMLTTWEIVLYHKTVMINNVTIVQVVLPVAEEILSWLIL